MPLMLAQIARDFPNSPNILKVVNSTYSINRGNPLLAKLQGLQWQNISFSWFAKK